MRLHRGWLSLVVAAVVVAACGGDRPSLSPSAIPSSASSPAAAASARPTPVATPTPATSVAPTATPVAATPTQPTSGDARLSYAEFLLRLADARPVAADLNATLVAAAERLDPDAVRRAAVAILDFADEERTWLRAHPPAECYADAHASAGRMVAAYAATAEAAIDWAAAGGALAGLDALTAVLDAASAAGDALEDLAADLEATRCAA